MLEMKKGISCISDIGSQHEFESAEVIVLSNARAP